MLNLMYYNYVCYLSFVVHSFVSEPMSHNYGKATIYFLIHPLDDPVKATIDVM